MGSFYVNCSITRKTICDDQEMYIQFMLPTSNQRGNISVGQIFKESFLNVVKTKGLEEAIKTFDELTSTWGKEKELSPKGIKVSDNSYSNWVPFGPSIKGKYNDCGDMIPSEDEENKKRIKILEGIMGGIPFDSILEIASDDRWYTYGLGNYSESEDSRWRPKGINKDMPEWLLELCKKISLTYFHSSAYEDISDLNFSHDDKRGILSNSYEIKWKNEHIDIIKKKFPKYIKCIKKISEDDENPRGWREYLNEIGSIRSLDVDLLLLYSSCIAREECDLDWFYQNETFLYGLSSLGVQLERSDYGSQSKNWRGWKRIYDDLIPKLEELAKEDDDEDEE